MKLTLNRYKILLFFQFAFLLIDLLLNSFTHFYIIEKLTNTIFLFILQDILIVFEYLLFTLAVYSTCVYEIGASHIIFRNCKFFLFTILIYFLLTASEHIWIVYNILWMPTRTWHLTLNALSIIQRSVAFLYYHTCKRTALTISDPRYYGENIDWIVAQLNTK